MNKEKKTEINNEVDAKKREFMKKFGTYAATVPVGMLMIMTPATSAHASSCNNGVGNGDQCSPGNSTYNNQAENDHDDPDGSHDNSGFPVIPD